MVLEGWAAGLFTHVMRLEQGQGLEHGQGQYEMLELTSHGHGHGL